LRSDGFTPFFCNTVKTIRVAVFDAIAPGDSCYIPELDAALTVFADQRRGEETLHLYKCDEKKWYTSSSSAYNDRGGWVDVLLMRLDPESFKLVELN